MKKITLLLGIALTLMLTLTGCTRNISLTAKNLMENIEKSDISPIIIDDPENKEVDKTGKITDFSLGIFKEIYQGENTLISPLSIISALSMNANGAENETLLQMEEVFGTDVDSLKEYLYAYKSYLPTDDKYKISLANSIWFKDVENFTVEKDFLQTNKDYYDAQIYKAPFDDSTKDDINVWVSKETDGQIKKLLEEKIPEDAVMYLINALSFDAEWENIYKDTDVRKSEFTTQGGEKTTVDFMHSSEEGYINLGNAVGFSKPYADKKYSFVALLPEEGLSVEDFIDSLDGETLINDVKNLDSSQVEVAIPKFEFEYDKELSEVLNTLGMKDAFDSSRADFSSLGHSSEGNIYINRILHKTKITLDEKGTKAGAITTVEMVNGSASMEEMKRITLNRPFFFMIVDNQFSMPIFMGTLNEVK